MANGVIECPSHSPKMRLNRHCLSRWKTRCVILMVGAVAGNLWLTTAFGEPAHSTAPEVSGISNAPTVAASTLDYNDGLGSWIWVQETHDKQTCRLWKSFEIPKSALVAQARLLITADNEYRLFLDGREVGHGSDWRSLTEYDLTWLLAPGTHVLAVEGFNDQDQAGVILGMRIEMEDGQIMEIT